jgi:putative copper export protein
MDAIVKASLYIGTVLLVGAGGYKYLVTRANKVSKALLISVVIGFLFITIGSVANLVLTVMNVLGRFDARFIWEYATNTQHGRMTFIRLGLAVLLVPMVLVTKWRQPLTVLFSLASLGFLATFSALSHATTMEGTPAFVTDLIHLSCASLWVGAITFSVLSKVWNKTDFETMMKRVSTIALICVVLLVSTGIYASLIHMKSFDLLFSTEYGRVLLVKIGIFSLTLVLAALNRWYFMPQLLAKKVTFKKVLITEVLLLFAVIAITGLLTVSALPHDMTR